MRRCVKGFTLLEVLVVVAIIAILTALLVPIASKVRQQSIQMRCLNTCRGLGFANLAYTVDNQRVLPFCDWGDSQQYSNAPVGWLYAEPLSGPDPSKVETGNFWKYLGSRDAYRCPTHVKGEMGKYGVGKSDALTSYLMNGAVNGYGNSSNGVVVYYRITQFKSDDILFWEADERVNSSGNGNNGAAWNDGSSYPWESFNINDPLAAGLTIRHGDIAMIACFDGHAEWITHEDFFKLAASSGRTRLWCKPGSASGH